LLHGRPRSYTKGIGTGSHGRQEASSRQQGVGRGFASNRELRYLAEMEAEYDAEMRAACGSDGDYEEPEST
jgi:hypothetical protein